MPLLPLKLVIKSRVTDTDLILVKLFDRLIQIIGDNLLSVESFEGWEGSNVRIIVRNKSDEIIEKIFNTIEEVEKELGKPGTIIPDIVSPNEL